MRIRGFFFAFTFVGKNVSRVCVCVCMGDKCRTCVPQFNRSEVYNYFCVSAVAYM